ncbi:MAG TPA: YcxB family protein [Pyrinomonadaceae bacterium]|jgi:hypothetical protein|nr:YcxB family protein [Pyrinomonadaceae bacterium]
MKIKFDTTIADHVYAYERLMTRSNEARSWRLQGTAATALLSGLISGILVFIIVGGSIPVGLILGSIAAIGSAAISWISHHNTVKRRLENYFREQFGDRNTFPVEVELTESGICTKQLGTQIIFEWMNIQDINETEDKVEIYTRNGGGLFIKKSDFSSDDEYRQFMKVTQQHLNISRTSSNWLQAG